MDAAIIGAGRPSAFKAVRGQWLTGLFATLLCCVSALAQADLTFNVNTVNDTTAGTSCATAGLCSVRAAINEANAVDEGTHAVITVAIPAGTYTLGAPLELRRNIRLIGSSGNQEGDPSLTTLQAGSSAFQPGNGQVMLINPGYDNSFDTYLAALTIRHGYNTTSLYGGAIDWDGEDTVGGENNGTLTIYNSVFADNAVAMAGGNGGAIAAYFGAQVTISRTVFRNNRVTDGAQASGAAGALLVVETRNVTLSEVEIDGNSAQGYGGALLSGMADQIDIDRTTVAGNRAVMVNNVGGQVGGLGLSDYTGDVRLLNSTFSGNEADGSAGGLRLAPLGGAGAELMHVTIAANRAGKSFGVPGDTGGGLQVVSALAPTVLNNTLVAANFGGTGSVADNLRGTVDMTSSHNLLGPHGDGGLQDGVNGNQLAVADARLLPLGDYHGRTRTHALDNGSPALDAAQTVGTSPTQDQRGWPRQFIAAGSAVPAPDIGAYEAHPTMTLIDDQEVLGLLVGAPTVDVDFSIADITQPGGVTVEITGSSNTPLLPLANIVLSGTGTERSLAITPVAGQWGSSDITVRITGSYNGLPRQRTQQFTVTVIAPPELSVNKSHSGDFYQGQTGADFTITVENIGDGATLPAAGVISVVDTLPAGLTATALAGTGWTCTLATVTCTRNDVLASGASYPAITLTVDVDGNAATSLINTVSAQGGGDSDGDSDDDTVKVLYRTATGITTGSSVYGTDFQIAASLTSPGPSPVGSMTLQYNNGAGWVSAGSQPITDYSAVFTLDGNSYDAGTHVFRAVFAGNADYRGSESAADNHVVTPAPQTLSWTPPTTVTFGDPAVTVPASSSVGLPVTLSSSDNTVFTVSGNVLTIVGAGAATLTASQLGTANYSAATSLTQVVTVAQRPATVTLGNLAQQYDGTPRAATVTTAPTGLNVTVTYDGAATVPANAGSYAVVATLNEANYTGSASGTLAVAKADQTITFDPLVSRTLGDAPFALAATASSGLAVTYTSSDTSVATVSGDQVTLVGAGTVTLTAAQAGNGNYNAAPPVDQTLTVNQASQAITFAPLAPVTFGDAPLTLTGTSDSGLPVSYASSDSSVATVSGNTLTIVGAGSATVTASQAGNDDYLPATDVDQTLVVNKATATVTLSDLTLTYTGAARTATAATTPAGLTVDVTYDGAATAPTDVGSYAVVATVNEANYQGSATGTLVIGQASQTITFDALPQRTYGDTAVTLSATSSSGLPVTFASDNPSVASVSGNTLSITGVGTANITASQAGDANYLAAADVSRAQVVVAGAGTVLLNDLTQVYDGTPRAVAVVTEPVGLSVDITYDGAATVPTDAGSYAVAVTITDPLYTGSNTGTLVIEKADQTITFDPLANRTVGDAAFSLGASASSGLAVSYTSSDPSVATVTGNQVTVVGAGSTTLTAEQAGDSNYNAATPVAQTLTVDKRDQIITFAAPGAATFGDAPVTLVATSDAGLPVTFESDDTSVVSINGNTAVIESAGSAVITARQVGNDDYNPASATQTLVVNLASQTLTFPQPADQDYPGSPVTLTLSATSSAGLPVTFTLDSGRATLDDDTLTLSGPGPVTVTASQPGDGNYTPASVTRSFNVIATANAEWTVTQCGNTGDGALVTVLADAVAGNTVRFEADLVCRDGTAIQPGAELLVSGLQIDGEEADIEINGGGSHRLFRVESGELTLRHLILKNGFTAGQGGAVLANNAFLTLENVQLRDNIAVQQGGAVAVTGPDTNRAVLRNVTATGNQADEGGALRFERPDQAAPLFNVWLENVTLAQNSATLQGGAISFSDNGVYDLSGGGTLNGLLSLRHVTVIDNSAPSGTALHMVPAQSRLDLINTVLAGATAAGELIVGAPAGTDVTGSLISFGDLGALDGDPLLSAVNEQGALAYYALLPGSAAIGAGDHGLCMGTDQRVVGRVGRCDAGAIQSRGFTLTLLSGGDQSAPIDAAFAAPLVASVASAFGEPVAGGRLDFQAPLTGASLNPAQQQATLDASGQVSLPVTANGVVGSYDVVVDATGLSGSERFTLENLPLTTSISLSQNGPVAVGETYTVTAVLTASGALPSGSIVFERHDGDAWQPFDSALLGGDTALLQRVADSVGGLSLRARFPGNATHLASGWEEVVVVVYPPLSVIDPQGGPLPAGGSRSIEIAGGEGGSYAIDVSGPAGFTGGDTLACGLASCEYHFSAPATGAFAGTYDITVTDQSTGWHETISIDVPLRVSLQRPVLLSRDAARHQTAVVVTGAPSGTAITLQPDVADSLDLAQASVVAADDSALGNPAVFSLRLLDSLAASRDVILTGSAGGLPDGEASLRAEQSVLYQGSVSGPLSEVIAGASVTLLRASDGGEALPLEDDQGRFLATTDALGGFTLIAPPTVAGADDSLEVSALDYRTLVAPVEDCLTPCALVMEAAVDAETPRFTPPAGTYAGGVQVRLESTTPGAMLRYTTDGSTPTLTHGTEVANNTHLLLTETTTLKVIAYKVGLNVSAVAEAEYRITAASLKVGGGSVGGLLLAMLSLLGLRRRRV
jgi:hypothetical protein